VWQRQNLLPVTCAYHRERRDTILWARIFAIITNVFIICVHFALSLSISGDRATLLIKEKVSQLIYRVHYGVKGTSPI